MKRRLVIAGVLAVVSIAGYIVLGDRPSFTIDRTQPFWLEFGRGSGMFGLDTIQIDQTGRVILHRLKSEQQRDANVLSWEVATLSLPPETITEVLNTVESNRLMSLDKKYHKDIFDGTQWVLWIKQGEHEKSVYFDNNFPNAITAFAKQLDAILLRAGADKAKWQPVPVHLSRQHEHELWDSIRR